MAPLLCDICLGVLQFHRNEIPAPIELEENDWLLFGHHQTPMTLKQSAEQGCYVCLVPWRQLSRAEEKTVYTWETDIARSKSSDVTGRSCAKLLTLDMFFTTVTLYGHEKATPFNTNVLPEVFRFGLRFSHGKFPTVFSEHSFVLDKLSLEEGKNTPTIDASVTSLNTLSEESLRQMKTWLDECYQSHRKCTTNFLPDPWYPTRLLYVESLEHGRSRLRVVNTAHEQPNEPYATLSHRWGDKHFIKLTRNNLSAFMQEIAIEELPQTFADAVSVTLRLGIKYLWIDSLCILQDADDLSDWLHEACLMHRVYSCAYVNLSASASEGSSGGLSRDRDPSHMYGPRVNVRINRSKTHTEFAEYTIRHEQLWRENIVRCDLNTRGWVFQERLLSPRVLHFGPDQVFWECRELRACERYPTGHGCLHDQPWLSVDAPLTRFKALLGDYERRIQDTSHSVDGNIEMVHDLWLKIVEVYSNTSLTDPRDKLIALAGIAKQTSIYTKDTYIAGMWRSHLEKHLLWRKVYRFSVSDTATPYPFAYRAPSWSWASIDGTIAWGSYDTLKNMTMRFEIVDVFLQHETDDIMGRIKGGWLDVKGKLLPGTVSFEGQDVREPDVGTWQLQVDRANLTHPENDRSSTHNQLSSWVSLDTPELDAGRLSEDNVHGRLYYMPTVSSEMYLAEAWLLRVVDSDSGIFERIGMVVEFVIPRQGDEIPLLLEELKETVRATLPCLQYQNGLHTIRII